MRADVDLREVLEVGAGDDGFELLAGLLLVDSPLGRSPLYHRVKDLQPAGEPLLVAPLDEAPKLKGMAPGAVAWLRARRFDRS